MLKQSVNPLLHKQSTPSDTWEIEHGLYTNPVVGVKVLVGGQLTEIIPKNIVYPTNTHVTISFSAPFSGEARLA